MWDAKLTTLNRNRRINHNTRQLITALIEIVHGDVAGSDFLAAVGEVGVDAGEDVGGAEEGVVAFAVAFVVALGGGY